MTRPVRPDKSVALFVLGCAKNQVEADGLAALLTERGWSLTPDLSRSRSAVVHSCGFLKQGRHEALSVVKDIRRKRPDLPIVLTGCAATFYLSDPPASVDGLLATGELHRLPDLLERVSAGHPDVPGADRPAGGYHHGSVRPLFPGQQSAYLRLSEGCSHRCSFCLIPALRGPHRSRPSAEILEEGRSLVDRGIKELVLIGQDTTAYGKDRRESGALERLIRTLSSWEGLAWLRLMYAYPSEVSDELLDLLAGSPKLCRYLDMPLQHISDEILKDMGRPGGEKATLRLIEKMLKKVPGLSLRTTFIVGFPGETENDFQRILNVVSSGCFEHVGIFAYSAEPGTVAFRREGRIPSRLVRERMTRLVEAQSRVIDRCQTGRIGRLLDVLVEKRAGDVSARAAHQAPDVDGGVRMKTFPQNPGIYNVRVTGYRGPVLESTGNLDPQSWRQAV
ncbi:MAG TPA: MiaB/RimO family radical SAM methylthiotransferase [Elusimicrobiota bacterium]|nr:MiaB/RimO family radical SAM methylthiotransferase [Elusimicrobiota bacterium]